MFAEHWRKKSREVLPPRSVQFLAETGCNLRCEFCDEPSSPKTSLLSRLPEDDSWEADVAFEEKRRKRFASEVAILDGLKEWGVSQVTFTGGEPTLDPNIEKLLREAKARGMRTSLATNGLSTVFFPRSWTILEGGFITPNLLDRIAKPLDVLKLSMHGACEETHDGIVHMHGSFAAVILNLMERQRYYTEDFGAEVTCVVTRNNLEQIGGIVDICCASGVDQLTLSQVYPRGKGNGYNKVPFKQIQQLKKTIEKEKRAQLKKVEMSLVVRQAVPSCVLVYPDGEVRVSYCPTRTGTERVGSLTSGNIVNDWKVFPPRKAYETMYRKNQTS